MEPRIFIALLVFIVATAMFFGIHRTEFSMRLKDNVFGSYTKAALFNTMFFVTTCLAIWELYFAVVRYELYIPRRGYLTLVINPATYPIQFASYLILFSLLLCGGIAFLSKALFPQKKV